MLSYARFLLLLTLEITSAQAANSVSDCLWNYRFRVTQSLLNFDMRTMTAWTSGGGHWDKIPEEDAIPHPFAGRTLGGAYRREIFGSRAFGSGYPYGVNETNTVKGRPFPFGTWPISWDADYAGSGEYGTRKAEPIRPGGRLVRAEVGTTDTGRWSDLSSEDVYHLVGDLDSVISVMGALVNGCSVTPKWGTPLVHGRNDSIRPENIIQYYRASSFALAHTSYTNSFALAPLNTSTQLTHDDSTPLSDSLATSGFLRCISDTIGGELPIMDALVDLQKSRMIFGAVFGSIFGAYVLLQIFCCYI